MPTASQASTQPTEMPDQSADWDWSAIRKRCTAEALRMLRRPHDAEEAVQEALTRAWRRRHTCHTPETPLPCCLQITRNEALRLIDRRRGSPSLETLEEREELPAPTAGQEAPQALVRVDLHRALKVLTPHERGLIALRYGHDCSHSEIAQTLDIPEATAWVRLHRVHKRLRELL
jgi:RNA polymerase sigma-70 factor, ECF subfamily